MRRLYCDITETSNIESVTITNSHGSASATANFTAVNSSLDLNDYVEIDMGYTDDHALLFTGYVKEIERTIPENKYNITCYDVLVRATDYFIVSPDPNDPYTAPTGIETAHLVKDILEMAGLTDFSHQDTDYLLGVENGAEVNLVSAYDYCKMLADLVTWHLWADSTGRVYFRNRKPCVMNDKFGIDSQPGYVADTSVYTINDTMVLDLNYKIVEKDLRNKVVVYGANGLSGEAKRATSYDPVSQTYIQVLPTTPSQFYKAAVVATIILDDQTYIDRSASYNLKIYNRIQPTVACTLLGNPSLAARTVITLEESLLPITTRDWYVYGCEHSLSRSGYTTSLELKM